MKTLTQLMKEFKQSWLNQKNYIIIEYSTIHGNAFFYQCNINSIDDGLNLFENRCNHNKIVNIIFNTK